MFGIIGGGALLAVLGLLWWAKGNWNAADTEFRTSAADQRQLESGNPYPSDANVRKMKGYLADYQASLDKLKAELATRVLATSPLAPNEFQSRLLQAITGTAQTARANRVKLPDNFKLGFDEFVSTLPKTEDAPGLGQELAQIQLLLNMIIEARVDAVTMFRRVSHETTPSESPSPMPASSRARVAPTSARPGATPAGAKLIERRAVEFSIAGPPSAVRKVINGIASANDQFFIMRTLHVKNQKEKGPPREGAIAGSTPPPIAAALPNATAMPAGSPVATPAGAIHFIVGNEHLDLSARVELIDFTF
jgi:hypothetical protein